MQVSFEMEFKPHIDKLKGASNWTTWRRQIELLLCHQEVLELVVDDTKIPDEPNEDATAKVREKYETELGTFKKRDAFAQLILVGSMNEANVQLTSTCDSANSIWEKLISVYEQSLGQRFDRLMEQFFTSALSNSLPTK